MKLWVGQTISWIGSALSRLAIPLIAALMLDATPGEMGILAAAGTTPALLFGLFAGVWVDRFQRRTLLIAGDIGRALLLITIPVAALSGLLTIWQLYLIGFLNGILSVIVDVASRSYLPGVVEREQLVEANGKLELSGSITSIAGPSLAGLVIQAFTAPVAIIVDAVTYLASAVSVLLIRHREDPPQKPGIPMLAQVRDGLKVVFHHPLLRAFAGCLGTSNFASNAFFAL